MKRRMTMKTVLGIGLGLGVSAAAFAQTTWTGGGADGSWTDAGNWSAGAPANPATALVAYNDSGKGMTGIVNAAGAAWTLGSVSVRNDSGIHTVNLDGKTLIVTNLLINPTTANKSASLAVTNGTIQFGTDTTAANILLGQRLSGEWDARTGNFIAGSGVTVDTRNIGTLTLGNDVTTLGTMDLRGATLANNEFKATRIVFGLSNNGNLQQTSRVLFGQTGVTFRVRYLDLGGDGSRTSRIGIPTGNETSQHLLPTNTSFVVGTSSARGRVYIAPNLRSDSRLEAAKGGTFTAHLTEMKVGGSTVNNGNQLATLDLSRMDRVDIDCSGKLTMYCTSFNWFYKYYATARFPVGTISFAEVELGALLPAQNPPSYDNSGSFALIELNGTTMRVSSSLAIRTNGTVTARIGATSAGVELTSAGTTFALDAGGKLQIVFTNAAVVCGAPFYGLKWPGDRVAQLQTWTNDGRLVINTNALGGLAGLAGIFLTNGVTYVGIPAQPVAIVPTDKLTGSHELMTDEVIDIAVSAAPFAGAAIEQYAVSETIPANLNDLSWEPSGTFANYTLTSGEGAVTLYGWAKDANGLIIGAASEILYSEQAPALTVLPGNCKTGTLTLVVAFETDQPAVGQVGWRVKDSGNPLQWSGTSLGTQHVIGVTGLVAGTTYALDVYANRGASSETNVAYEMTTTVPLAAGDPANWTGGGDPYLSWGDGFNWAGNRPPTNPATGTITFGTQAMDKTGILNTDWTAGTLRYQNTVVMHVVDLGGKTLRINTLLDADAATANLRLQNGRLELRGQVVTSAKSAVMGSTPTLTIATGTELDLDASVYVNVQGSGTASLDLRGVVVATNALGRRVLTFNGLQIGVSTLAGGWESDNLLWLDETTVADELRFTSHVRMGLMNGNNARIGKLVSGVVRTGTWRLPDNRDLTFGTTTPVELEIGYRASGNSSARFHAGTGGVLRANLALARIGARSDYNGNTTGSLLLGDMAGIESFACAGTIEVGTSGNASYQANGTISLPPGDATTANLTVGSTNTGSGVVTLNGTRLTVGGAATIAKTGVVTNHVYGASAGLAVTGGGGLLPAAPADSGKLHIVFHGPKPVGADPYWGLRLAGNHLAALQALETAGKLAWDDDVVGGKVEIFRHGGDTYVGIPPPGGTMISIR